MMVWNGKSMYTLDEASVLLGVETSTIHRLIRLGELGACRMGSGIGIPPQYIEEYRQTHQQEDQTVSV
jgi:excisionase family DNA binding protein